jgi:hypothetical protein
MSQYAVAIQHLRTAATELEAAATQMERMHGKNNGRANALLDLFDQVNDQLNALDPV